MKGYYEVKHKVRAKYAPTTRVAQNTKKIENFIFPHCIRYTITFLVLCKKNQIHSFKIGASQATLIPRHDHDLVPCHVPVLEHLLCHLVCCDISWDMVFAASLNSVEQIELQNLAWEAAGVP